MNDASHLHAPKGRPPASRSADRRESILLCAVRLFAEVVFMNYSGNFAINIPLWLMAESVAIGFVTYLVVALFHVRAVKRVRLEEALKVQE